VARRLDVSFWSFRIQNGGTSSMADDKDHFFPAGAIAFFWSLILYFTFVWFLMFWILLRRG
jgi:hypothetical protein